jgi:hypothetical protein
MLVRASFFFLTTQKGTKLMAETITEALPLSIDLLISHACGNPDREWDLDKTYEENMQSDGGWNIYRIELHCVAFKVSARKVDDGVFDQEKEVWITPPHYEVRSYEIEDC